LCGGFAGSDRVTRLRRVDLRRAGFFFLAFFRFFFALAMVFVPCLVR
jgi:hypothetical protein